MLRTWREWALAVVAVCLLALVVDWVWASAQIGSVRMDASPMTASVTADSKSSIRITVRITQHGRPRSHDLLQSWIDVGSGLLLPMWVYTDENGLAEFVYTPNAVTPYDVQDHAVIHVRDVSIGRLVEVSKDLQITIQLLPPEDQKQENLLGSLQPGSCSVVCAHWFEDLGDGSACEMGEGRMPCYRVWGA